jgi:hypothetical protein
MLVTPNPVFLFSVSKYLPPFALIGDLHVIDGRIVERFSQKDYLIYLQLRFPQFATPIDLSAISTIETDPASGAIHTLITSVTDPLLPEDTTGKYSRCNLDLQGWVFTPQFDDNGVTMAVSASFISYVDYGFSLPSAAIRSLKSESSLYVAQVQDYLVQHGCPPYVRRVAGKIIKEDFNCTAKSYEITYIVKHDASGSRRKQQPGAISSWCTDIRIPPASRKSGLQVQVSPSDGIRVEMTTDHASLRIYSVEPYMDGKVVILTMEDHVSGGANASGKFTLNGEPLVPRLMVVSQQTKDTSSTPDILQPQPPVDPVPSSREVDKIPVPESPGTKTEILNVQDEASVLRNRKNSADSAHSTSKTMVAEHVHLFFFPQF